MKTDIETIKESFWYGYDMYYDSRVEAEEVWNMYHNRQWTKHQQNILENRGQPKETFNVIKLFSRMLVGYYSTVINTVRAAPKQESDAMIAGLVTDTINAVFDANNMDIEGDKIKLSGIVSGLMCARVEPYLTGERDKFNRPLYNIDMAHVPEYELVLDPLSTEEDYSDARFLHRFKWVPEEVIMKVWPDKLEKLTSLDNHLNIDEADFEYAHSDGMLGRHRVFDNYLVVHTVIEDDKGKRWSIFWCGDVELERKEITYRKVKFPYRVVKLHTSNKTEYYGIFREVVETQKAINQALVKLQLMANTQKAFVEKGAVENVKDFEDAFNRVNGVIPVKKLSGVKVENLAREALEQYQIIDRALDRIQRLLSINDSFLGMAYASDSGRKVKLQQNATVMALRYLTVRIQTFYKLIGDDVANLIPQFYTANQMLRVSDELLGERFIELNKPMEVFSGRMDANGQPIMEYMFEPVLNPDTQEQEVDDEGNLVFAPIPEEETEIYYTPMDIKIESVAYNDEDERAQLMVETILSGNMGQMLAQVSPSHFFRAGSLTLKTMKTKFSPELSKIFNEVAEMLAGNPAQEEGAAQIAQGSQNQNAQMSSSLKLPTNTNEAV